MDNLSFKKSTENVIDNEENSSTIALSDIINNGTNAELDEVDLRNGINEFHPSEVYTYQPISPISIPINKFVEIILLNRFRM